MKKLMVLILAVQSAIVVAQTKEIYVNPAFNNLARDHKIVAILPFKAIVKLRPREMQRMTQEQHQKLQKDEGMAVQSALHTYFLKRKSQHDIKVDFLDLNTTNAILTRNLIDEENIADYTPKELAEILDVDAVITGLLSSDKPMSDGASMAMGLLIGVYGPTNSGKCTININDRESGTLLWKYEKTLSRSLGSDTNTIVNAMMRKASRQLPYIVR